MMTGLPEFITGARQADTGWLPKMIMGGGATQVDHGVDQGGALAEPGWISKMITGATKMIKGAT